MYMQRTWRIDRENKIEMAFLNIFLKSFPQDLGDAGFHMSLIDILDRKLGLHKYINYNYL